MVEKPNLALIYVHDPMCSWCYAFAPVLKQLQAQLSKDIVFTRLLGGLAVDTDEPMPKPMQRTLQATWQKIQASVPGTPFNTDFWANNQPRRSTWPSCRAVIAAREIHADHEAPMIHAIQQAYYQQARNPSDDATLIALASEQGLPREDFTSLLNANETQQQLDREIARSQSMGIRSFPSLVFDNVGDFWPIAVDYRSPESMLNQIDFILDDA